jgi:hypothetical protein
MPLKSFAVRPKVGSGPCSLTSMGLALVGEELQPCWSWIRERSPARDGLLREQAGLGPSLRQKVVDRDARADGKPGKCVTSREEREPTLRLDTSFQG